jgi:hypothetical protein
LSTKIYTAYRTKKNADLFDIVRKIKAKASGEAVNRIELFLWDLSDAIDITSEEFKKAMQAMQETQENRLLYRNEQFIRSKMAAEFMDASYRKQISLGERNPFHLDCSVSIHELDGRFYIIPYEDMKMTGTFDFLKRMPELENYQYWNNTDHPEDVSDRAWRNREANWDTIHERGWGNYLSLEIVSKGTWYLFNPLWSLKPDGTIDKKKILEMVVGRNS